MKVLFVGTAGGRVTTFRLLRRSGGFLVEQSGSFAHVDPGPGAFVYLKELGVPYTSLELFLLSHLHLDHSADLNALLEAATDGGKRDGVAVFAPKSVFEGEDRVLFPYLRRRLTREGFFEQGHELSFKSWRVKPVYRHAHHGTPTYSFLVNETVLYVPCSRFEERMLEYMPEGVPLLVINTTFYRRRPFVDHLSAEEAALIIKRVKPKRAVITHFSKEMLKAGPERVAEELSAETGHEVLAAYDGMVVEV
ncbi:MAG: MBL fold metallo-hydrolase [Aquificae bacterium]|nr:MBL fold metallo-hydrolase [Aquificota bacterium]